MKRKLLFKLSVFILVICTFVMTNITFAAEIFEDNGTIYSIDEIKLKIDTLSDTAFFWNMDGNYYIFRDFENDKMYRVSQTECIEMTMQECLDYLNSSKSEGRFKYRYNDGYDIYELSSNFYVEQNLIKTKDTSVDLTKSYQKPVMENGQILYWDLVTNPVNEDLDKYYEAEFFKLPESTVIDTENITYYYTDEKTGIIEIENNPTTKNILDLRVKVDEERETKTKIATIDKEVYEKIMDKYWIMDIFEDEKLEKIYFMLGDLNSDDTVLCTLDGTIIEDISDIDYMNIYGNSIIAVNHKDNTYRLYNKDFEGIFESNNFGFLEFLNYDKFINQLVGFGNGDITFYNMFEYKLLSEDNQVYNKQDLEFKYSIDFSRLKSVKVNDKILDNNDYEIINDNTLKLKSSYLDTLTVDTYTLKVEYIDGAVVESNFVIKEVINIAELDDTPKTGKNFDIVLIICLFMMVMSVARMTMINKKSKELK